MHVERTSNEIITKDPWAIQSGIGYSRYCYSTEKQDIKYSFRGQRDVGPWQAKRGDGANRDYSKLSTGNSWNEDGIDQNHDMPSMIYIIKENRTDGNCAWVPRVFPGHRIVIDVRTGKLTNYVT